MHKHANFSKRAQSWVLVVSIVVSLFTPMLNLHSFAQTMETEKTVGGIVAENYKDFLSAAEQNLIGSELLIGETHKYVTPGESDTEELISVDSEAKKITAESYEDDNGNVFKPVSAQIYVNDSETYDVALTDGVGYYTYDGNAFAVDVTYALYVEVDADLQQALINAPDYLAGALDEMTSALALTEDLEFLASAEIQDVLMAMTSAPGYQVALPGTNFEVGIFFMDSAADIAAKNAVLALNKQVEDNGGMFDLTKELTAYSSGSKFQYLVKDLEATKAVAAQTRDYLEEISNSDTFNNYSWYSLVLSTKNKIAAMVADIDAFIEKDFRDLSVVLRDDLSDSEYAVLDTLVALATLSKTDKSQIEVKNPLLVDSATLRYNMAMYNITVNVSLTVVENNEVINYGQESVTITLPEEASKDQILDAIDATNVVAAALENWDDVYVAGKYEFVMVGVPEILMQDTTVSITYSPKNYTVTLDYDEDVTRPYGYVIFFAKHEDATKAYDYYVNGTYYAQGSSYVVVDNASVTRKEGKAYTTGDFYGIIADNYLEGKGDTILTSGAILNNVEVNVRYPDNKTGIVALSSENVLTAKPFDASYAGLKWVPYSYTIDGITTEYFVENNGTYEVALDDFNTVTVAYRLDLIDAQSFSKEEVLAIVNLPNELKAEATLQLQTLDRIANQKNSLDMLNKAMVNGLKGIIEGVTFDADLAKDQALKVHFTNVLGKIANTRMAEDVDGKPLKLAVIANEYSSAQDPLLYYYQNSTDVIHEISEFSLLMTELLGEGGDLTADEKKAGLETLIRQLPANMLPAGVDIDEYIDRLPELEGLMAEVRAALTAPNAVINLDSNKLDNLTAAIRSSTTKEFTLDEIKGLYLVDNSMPAFTSNEKIALTVTIVVEGKTATLNSQAILKTKAIPQSLIDALKADVAAKLAELQIAGVEYNGSDYAAELDTLVGQIAGDLNETTFEYGWSYVVYTVEVPEVGNQQVSYADSTIDLAVSLNPNVRYDYYVNGTLVSGNTYKLSAAELIQVGNGTFKVTINRVDILRETLIKYVNELNASVGSDIVAFALVEDASGKFSIVMKIDGVQPDALMGAVQGMAMGIVQGSYSYVGIDGNAFLTDDSKISLQALIDALTNSGFGSDTILSMMDANGNINHITVDGTVVSDKSIGSFGGLLMETSMQLGASSDKVSVDVPFYVTLGSVSEELVQVRNAFAGDLGKFLTFECVDGSFGLKLNLPEKAYEAFLAVLLVTEKIDITDINAVNGEIAITFFNDILIPLFEQDVSIETFENTLAKFGVNYDFSSPGAEKVFDYLKNYYNNAAFTYDETSGTATGTVSISALVDSMDLGVLGNMIAEYQTGLQISVGLSLKNLGNDYEALYVDVDASGITNKIGLVQDLSAKLDEIAGTSLVVLLDDIDDDLVFNTTTLLNLNGFTVNGNLTANGKTIVVDSYVMDDKNGAVTGTLSGNLTLVAGQYDSDTSAFVKNGFVQGADGVVTNKFYTIDEDASGNVIISINAGLIHADELPDVTGLALDLVCDLLFNGYSSNYLALEGNTIYDITVSDLIGLYTSTNRVDSVINEVMGMVDTAQLSTFINIVLDDVMDFAAISNAIAKDGYILDYSMTTKPWAVEFIHDKDGDYLNSNLTSGKDANEKVLKIKLVGDDSDKKYFEDLFSELGETVESDINVNISHSKDHLDISLGVEADANVKIGWSDVSYGIMFSVIAADGIGAPKNAALIDGIRSYYETGDISALSFAFNSLTTAQVIDALKNLSVSDNFTAMIAALGLNGVVAEDVVELEALYDKIGKVVAAVVRKADLDGNNRTLASYLGQDGYYDMSRNNVEKLYNRVLFRGYGISVDLSIPNFYVGLRLFDTVPSPEFVDDHGHATVDENEVLFGSRVDLENQMILLDTVASGITVAQLKALLNFETVNTSAIEFVFTHGEKVLADEDRVPNGTKVTAIAVSNVTDKTDEVEYTVIILGDTNEDGKIAVGDAVMIARCIVGEVSFTELQTLAADSNDNGRTDVGDAVRIALKITNNDYATLIQ